MRTSVKPLDDPTLARSKEGDLSATFKSGKYLWWDVEPILAALRAYDRTKSRHEFYEETKETLGLQRARKVRQATGLGDFGPIWNSLGLHDPSISRAVPDFDDNNSGAQQLSEPSSDCLDDPSPAEYSYAVETKIVSLGSDYDVDIAKELSSPPTDFPTRDSNRDSGYISSNLAIAEIVATQSSVPLADAPSRSAGADHSHLSAFEDSTYSDNRGSCFEDNSNNHLYESRRRTSKSKPKHRKKHNYYSDTSIAAGTSSVSAKKHAIQSESARRLVPTWVTPNPIPLDQKYLRVHIQQKDRDCLVIRPLLDQSLEDKRKLVMQKLAARHRISAKSLMRSYKRTLFDLDMNVQHDEGVHVFVDSSNIMVGFHQSLKRARNIDLNDRVPGVPIEFELLALVLERGRPVTRRVLAGSVSMDQEVKNPKSVAHFRDAEVHGYEVCILQRVAKRSSCGGYIARNTTRGDTLKTQQNIVMAEQCVDEILQMKMLESIVDAAMPSTMVVATGDGAPAEFSSGFLANIERALEKGWRVELVTWKEFVNSAYISEPFRYRWGDQFMVVELDDYLEELLGSSNLFASYRSS